MANSELEFYILAQEFKDLKNRVTNEVKRRHYRDPVNQYGENPYLFTETDIPIEDKNILVASINKLLVPLNAINNQNFGFILKESDNLIENEIERLKEIISKHEKAPITGNSNQSTCGAACTGMCIDNCTSCTGCTGCTSCTSCTGCSGCSSCTGCSGDCTGGCGNCANACTYTCYDAGARPPGTWT